MGGTFKVGICQPLVIENKEANLAAAGEMIGRAAELDCSLVVLPEMFNCPYALEYFPGFAERIPGGPTSALLSQLAEKYGIFLVGGSIPEVDGEGRIFNTSTVFDPGGGLIARHRKLHLFDVNIPGGISFQESKVITAGNENTVFSTPLASIGLAICYDLRFPELARSMCLNGAQILIYPAAFNMTTGPAHWEILLRTRAVDNQVYVVAASPARNQESSYQAYGHSMIVDPWGTVLAEAGDEPGLIIAEIEPEKITRTRQELPLLKHRRPEQY